MTDIDDDLELDVALPAKKSNKLFLIIGLVAILGITGAVGAWLFLGGVGEETEVVKQTETVKQVAPAPPKELLYIAYEDDVVAGVRDAKGKIHFFRVALTFMTRNPKLKESLEKHKPLVINDLLAVYESEAYETLQTSMGRRALRTKTLTAVKNVMKQQAGTDDVEAVLFTKFIME